MGIASFLSALFSDGRVRVEQDDLDSERVMLEAADVLRAFEHEQRDELPGTPPTVSIEVACHGAAILYRACQLLVYRDAGIEVIRSRLRDDRRFRLSPSIHYSVDLTLRFLPDVIRLARSMAATDPLVEHLVQLAGRWPLSSVGIKDVTVGKLDTFVSDPCLLRLYVDRIITCQDASRLSDQRVFDAVRCAIGAFPELGGELAKRLVSSNVETRSS